MRDMNKFISAVKYFLLAACVILLVKYSGGILNFFRNISSAGVPLITGLAIAYVLNILMKKLEKVYFPNSKKKVVKDSRRGVCIFLSILLITAIIVILALIVIPELINAVTVLVSAIPGFMESAKDFIKTNSDKYTIIESGLERLQVDLDGIFKSIMVTLSGILTGLMNSAFSFVGSLTSGLMNFIIAITFAIYVLANKEKLSEQLRKVMKAFLSNKTVQKLDYVLNITNSAFSNFIVGQCVEAVILGCLCTAGMLLFRFPYAATVGAFISATALIPVVGAYIGAALGAFMILTVSPMKALLFLVFISVLQQLENNLIYPRVVGSSIGLPGIWVFAAITIGGGLGGIVGMLLSVPIAASIYKIFATKVNQRLKSSESKA